MPPLEGALDARAGSLWHKTDGEAIPRNSPRHRGGSVWYDGLSWYNTGWLLTLEMIGDNSEHHLSLPVVAGCDDSQQIVTGFRFLSFYRGQASFHHNEL